MIYVYNMILSKLIKRKDKQKIITANKIKYIKLKIIYLKNSGEEQYQILGKTFHPALL